jgi:hypothetical protein
MFLRELLIIFTDIWLLNFNVLMETYFIFVIKYFVDMIALLC